MQTVAFNCCEIDVTPVVSASAIYASGDMVGGIQTLATPAMDSGRFAQLLGLTIIDFDGQHAAFTVLLFNQLPTITSVDNGAFAITNANLAAQCIAQVPIVTGDYATQTQSVATKTFTNVFLRTQDNLGLLYASVVTTGTPTYTTTSSLVFKYNFAKQF